MAKKLDLDAELDRLYGDPPDGFVAGRNELVKRLKADGRKEEVAEVKGLKKPTRPAALVNWLSRERERDVATLAEIAERMRDPKLGGDAKKLRAAVAEEREAVDGLLAAAAEEMKERGGPAATLDRVAETLRAMASDPEVEELVLARRLEREQEAATVGFAMEGISFTPSKAKEEKRRAAKRAKPRRPDPKKLRTAATQADEAARAAEDGIEGAAATVEEAEAELQRARDALKDAKAEARRARSEAKKAARRLEATEAE